VYAIAALAGPLAPSLAVYYDVRKVHGAYLELGAARRHGGRRPEV
jgi:hypothetical protein